MTPWDQLPADVTVTPRHFDHFQEKVDPMSIALRKAEVVWDGTLVGGTGALSSASGALELPVTWASRTEQPEGKTSPEELIAAAHASCFAMALALVLGENQSPPDRLTVTATCTLDEIEGAPRITTTELIVRARVPSLDEAGLRRNVSQAADLCPVSHALHGNVAITVRDELDGA
jgi:osmotically inducible protein OsmC